MNENIKSDAANKKCGFFKVETSEHSMEISFYVTSKLAEKFSINFYSKQLKRKYRSLHVQLHLNINYDSQFDANTNAER